MVPSITAGFAFISDPLSLFFAAVILLISAPAAVYSSGYLKGGASDARIRAAGILLALFVLSMLAVVTASDLVLFLVAWEVMSLLSYFLVIYEFEHERSVKAGAVYLVMTHFGTALITAAFLIMHRYTGTFDLLAVRDGIHLLPAGAKSAVFLLLLFGFGAKAGMVPLHIWLPMAHPQAPSHISGVMSGVMIKLGVYGIIRFAIFTLGTPGEWQGGLVVALASVSCLLGVFYALMTHDIKRLLAYSSIENMGIILLAVGFSMVFSASGRTDLSAFALAAGLYHLLNHAVFKGLLFLGAGAVHKASGTRDMEKLGGLIKRMSYTAFAFLAGSMAISALPPLNGFISEWLVFQAIFAGALHGGGALFWLAAAVLALTGGLAAACFVKAFSAVFLTAPRSTCVSQASEVPASMKGPMLFLAFLTLALALAAPLLFPVLTRVAAAVLGAPGGAAYAAPAGHLITGAGAGAGAVSPWLVLAAILLAGAAAFSVLRAVYGARRAAVGRVWDCGYYKLDHRAEYTATAFSKPFGIFFGFLLMPHRKIEKATHAGYHLKYFRYEIRTTPFFRTFFYEPAVAASFRLAKTVRRMQPGSIHLYLAYIFAATVLLLLFRRGS